MLVLFSVKVEGSACSLTTVAEDCSDGLGIGPGIAVNLSVLSAPLSGGEVGPLGASSLFSEFLLFGWPEANLLCWQTVDGPLLQVFIHLNAGYTFLSRWPAHVRC